MGFGGTIVAGMHCGKIRDLQLAGGPREGRLQPSSGQGGWLLVALLLLVCPSGLPGKKAKCRSSHGRLTTLLLIASHWLSAVRLQQEVLS